MRSIPDRARWATLALALTLAVPVPLASADVGTSDTAPADGKKKRRSVSECTSFDQRDRETEDGVDFTITNSCTAPVACSLRWTVTCAPASKKRRSRKSDSHSFQLAADAGIKLTASAERCGDDGWSVDDISWSCAPSQD